MLPSTFALRPKLPDVGITIFTTMSRLAVEHGAINLSQGFPDYDTSPDLVEAVARAMRDGHNQYAPMAGVPALREALAAKIAQPERTVVAFAGDGDFMMGNTAVWTAAHYRIPILFLVANNRSFYNDEVHQERMAKQRGRPVENKWIGQRLQESLRGKSGPSAEQPVQLLGPQAHMRGDLVIGMNQQSLDCDR